MHRRNFIEASASLLAAIGLVEAREPDWMRELIETGKLSNRRIELNETLVIKKEWASVLFDECEFIAKPGFSGRYMIVLEDFSNVFLKGCDFNGNDEPEIEACIFIMPNYYNGPRWEYGDGGS
jgi:hypothetical protein